MNAPESFGDHKSLDPFTEKRIADKVRSALTDHADRVEPAANSYLTLSSRLSEELSSTPKVRGRAGARVLAAAAMFVVVAGAGIFALNQSGGSDFEATGGVANGTTAPVSAPPVATTGVVPTTTPGEVATTLTFQPPEPLVQVLQSPQLPSSSSVSEASRAFVHLLGLPGLTRVEERDSIGILLPPGDLDYGGPVPELAQVTTQTDSNGTAAVSATSETMQIESVRLAGEEIVVIGRGTAFEAWVGVQLISTDGTRLASTFTMAGCCEELVAFEARLPLPPGVGEAFVVAHSDNAGSGVLPAFAAVPIRYEGSVDDSTYTVFRIHPNDSDRGLNIRDLPGTDEGEVLATLPSGTSGVQRLPRMPALVGDSFWWRVRTADNIDGWVHSSFLTPQQPGPDDADIRSLAESAVFGISAAEFDGLSGLSLSRRVPVAVGWIGDPTFVVGPELVDPAFWTEARLWRVPEATFGEPETIISLRSLMNLPDLNEQAPTLQFEAVLPYGFEQTMAEHYFAGTQAVTVLGPETGEPNRTTVLFFESSPTGPQLVGVVVSIFVP